MYLSLIAAKVELDGEGTKDFCFARGLSRTKVSNHSATHHRHLHVIVSFLLLYNSKCLHY